MPVARMLLDAGRGALIGTVEIIPGVSGGTVALIIGVYETLIESAGHLARGVARGVADGVRGRGMTRARAELAAVRWSVVLPVGVGMIALGGLLYTAGAIVYATKKPDPSPEVFGYHEIFHLFVIAAAAIQYAAIAIYALPEG